MSCLTEDRLIEMLDGRGLESARPDERTHLAACDACQDAWAGIATAAEVLSGARPRRSRRAALLFPLAAAAGVLAAVIGLVLLRSDGPPPTPRQLVGVLLDGSDEDSRRARELLASAGPAARHPLLEARRVAGPSARGRSLHALLHALRGPDEGLRRTLERRTDLNMKAVPFSDFRAFVVQFSGVNLVLDPGLPAATWAPPIDLDTRASPLREALDLACTVLDLDYDFRYGVVFVSTPARLWRGEHGQTRDVLPLANHWTTQDMRIRDQATADKLRRMPLTIDMQNAPLSGVVDYVREISGVPITLDPSHGIRTLSLQVSELKLEHVIALTTLPLGLDGLIHDGTLQLYVPQSASDEKPPGEDSPR